MKLKDYLRDKLTELLLELAFLFLLLEFLHMIGNTSATIILIAITYVSFISIKILLEWYRKKTYFKTIKERVEDLEQPWLIAELLPDSYRIEDKLYEDLLRTLGSSAIEQIHKMEDEQREYEDYIEEWIHEVKSPITSIKLMLENRFSDNPSLKKDLNVELSKIENDVERALYYARSEEVYKDYLIQKLDLRNVLLKAINKNRVIIMNSSITVKLECEEELYIYGDEKWLIFLISQILLNAIKYRKEKNAYICLNVEKEKNNIILKLFDNGTGIKEEELARIFDKGFTGSNGRKNERSTGMGLYLVKKLCKKLGIEVWAKSNYGEFTAIYFKFSKKHGM